MNGSLGPEYLFVAFFVCQVIKIKLTNTNNSDTNTGIQYLQNKDQRLVYGNRATAFYKSKLGEKASGEKHAIALVTIQRFFAYLLVYSR